MISVESHFLYSFCQILHNKHNLRKNVNLRKLIRKLRRNLQNF